MKIGASHTPMIAEKRQKRPKHPAVDIFIRREGSTQAMTSIAMKSPQKTSWLPNMNEKAAGLEATPRAQKADMRRPMNMRT